MKNRMHGFVETVRREAGIIAHDKDLMIVLLLAPMFYAFFYGSIYWYKSERDIPIVVVDQDHSAASREFIRRLDAHPLLRVEDAFPDMEEAEKQIYSRAAEAIVYIPSGFESGMKERRGSDVRAFVNNSRFLVGNDITKALNEIAFSFGGEIRASSLEAAGVGKPQTAPMINPIEPEMIPLFSTTESYGDFLIPGLLVIILHQTLLMGLSMSIAKERHTGSLGELAAKSKRSLASAMLGKGTFYLLLYCSYTFFFFVVHFSLFHVSLKGDLAALGVLTVLMYLSAILIGGFVASFFPNKIVALQFTIFTTYPIFLLSGYSWPLGSMPLPVRSLAHLLPTTPYLQAFVRITQMGAGWHHILPELFQLLGLFAVGLILVLVRIRSIGAKTPASIS